MSKYVKLLILCHVPLLGTKKRQNLDTWNQRKETVDNIQRQITELPNPSIIRSDKKEQDPLAQLLYYTIDNEPKTTLLKLLKMHHPNLSLLSLKDHNNKTPLIHAKLHKNHSAYNTIISYMLGQALKHGTFCQLCYTKVPPNSHNRFHILPCCHAITHYGCIWQYRYHEYQVNMLCEEGNNRNNTYCPCCESSNQCRSSMYSFCSVEHYISRWFDIT